jgi:signal transduction histidine kinase
LLAEDDVTSRRLLGHWIEQWGYAVQVVEDGVRAMEALCAPRGPRLAVLDWNMPGKDGVRVCRELGERSVPYVHSILITSTSDAQSQSEALDSGASDFLSKPIRPEELRSRLGVGCRVLAYQEQLAVKNASLRRYALDLETLARSRAQQLLHADRMATLGLLVAGLAHEINNPATFISGNAQTLDQFWKDVEPLLRASVQECPAEQRRKLDFVLEELPRAVAGIQGGVKRIAKIVRGLKAYARQGKGECQACAVNQCLDTALTLCSHELASRGIRVVRHLSDGLSEFWGDGQQIEQVFLNLMMNAAQAMQKSELRELTLTSGMTAERRLRVTIEDTGPGIPAAILPRIWQPFFTTKPAGEGTGLGLSICKDIVKAHEGELSAENRVEGGARFMVELPVALTER